MATKTLYTLIVADDEDELREAVCTMVPWQEYGFKLLGSASNGLDALQMVEQYEPDLLPAMSGRFAPPPTSPFSVAMTTSSTPNRPFNTTSSVICSNL